jgi:myo-inositol-1(or 4)-monophosphatase
MTQTSPTNLLALAIRVAADGAALAQVKREQFITEVRTKSTETDVVTAADHAVERLVIDALLEARPGDAILSEESGERAPDRVNGRGSGRVEGRESGREEGRRNGHQSDQEPSVRWILDPIDGTVNYLYGLPFYAVSLAAAVDGAVVAGVVHNIATGDVYTATVGGGAYLDGRRIGGSTVTELSQTLVTTGFGYDAQRRLHQASVVAGLAGTVRDIRRFGAGALDLCLAATGAVDAYYEKGLNEWDIAAGVLIAREAGLLVTGLGEPEPGIEFVLAAPPAIHGHLHDVLAKLDASGGP